ncbi:methyltransferase [Chitinophaga parva]|uniref:Methyltransferase n=1 Tax=Chitinophaga parva TaxID=2169414 RepID=A0A2T7BFH7_9BACT|nr:methyltransferase domain-containing protein [Chitinophaga parva]PUZ25038.1 methyltransferase [Chitinophaga parva]
MKRKRILDVTAGSKKMWFNKKHPDTVYTDFRDEDITLFDGRMLQVRPDVVADFRSLPFPDESFHLVVFDPPHLKELGGKSVMAQSYGVLFSTWETDIRDGWLECMRVLRPNGTLIFKWNEFQITLNQVLAVIPGSPLFGHTSGKHGRTKWMAFIK